MALPVDDARAKFGLELICYLELSFSKGYIW